MIGIEDAIKRAVTPGVTERPPVPGFTYCGFVVHGHAAGPVTLAIAHREGRKAVLDLIREGLTVAGASALLHRYGLSEVTGLSNDEGDDLALAACGALTKAMRQ